MLCLHLYLYLYLYFPTCLWHAPVQGPRSRKASEATRRWATPAFSNTPLRITHIHARAPQGSSGSLRGTGGHVSLRGTGGHVTCPCTFESLPVPTAQIIRTPRMAWPPRAGLGRSPKAVVSAGRCLERPYAMLGPPTWGSLQALGIGLPASTES